MSYTLKPSLTIEEQIQKLKTEHKLIVNDLNNAKLILSFVNYYRLSGCAIGLKKDDKALWQEFLQDFINLMQNNKDIVNLNFIDFTENWESLLKPIDTI